MKKISALCLIALLTASAQAAYIQAPYPTTKGGTGVATQTANRAVTTDGSAHIVSTSPTTATEIGYVNGVTSAIQTQLNAKVNAALSNLSTVAINTALLPGVTSTIDLGSSTFVFRDFYGVSLKDSSGFKVLDLTAHQLSDTAGAMAVDFSSASQTVFAHPIVLNGSTSGSITISSDATPTPHTVTLPPTVCSAGQFWTDNGSGVMSCTSSSNPNLTVVNGGDAPYAIQTGDGEIRSGTTLTADRAYTLPACAANIGERHIVKNLPAQTFNINLTAAGADVIDGLASIALLPGDSYTVICAVSGTWDLI